MTRNTAREIAMHLAYELSFNDLPVEEFLDVTKTWGYFSRKDGLVQHFCLCEDCYDRMIAAFVRRPETRQEIEYFPPVFAEECID